MKKSILNLNGSEKLLKTELKKIQGGAYYRYCCEYREDANGNLTNKCLVWSVPAGAGTACP